MYRFSPLFFLSLIAPPLVAQTMTPPVSERIEIVRGPQSPLYGSQAMAGVVNIVTAPYAQGPSGGRWARAW
jgi:outer membrane receptor for ferrienterochelin and colicin